MAAIAERVFNAGMGRPARLFLQEICGGNAESTCKLFENIQGNGGLAALYCPKMARRYGGPVR